jgi:hypothetical protein
MSSEIMSEEERIHFTYSVLELHQFRLYVLGDELQAIESLLAIFQVAAGCAVVELCPYFGFHPRVVLRWRWRTEGDDALSPQTA